MFIGHFTEQPWQDQKTNLMGARNTTLDISNELYDPMVGADLYNRYIDEKLYAEEVGFDGLMLNEHHSTPFCMQGVTNVEAGILARQTSKAKIIILGNILPIWEDPLWLAETLSMIDMISRGRLVSGFVRGGGTESISHNAPPPYNWERFQEAHDFIIKAWTTPGPWRWEGRHYEYRYVNPWSMPYQKPHPSIWIPGVISPSTTKWAAEHRYPYLMLATKIEPTKEMYQLYRDTATEFGYEAGSQNIGYMVKVHVEETEEKAEEVARKYLTGVANPEIAGNPAAEGRVVPWLQSPPGLSSRDAVKKRIEILGAAAASGPDSRGATIFAPYEQQVENLSIIAGTPESVLPKIRHVLEELRPGSLVLWDGDGAMDHGDQMRSLKLMGEEVLPAVREMGKELELFSPFEVSPTTGEHMTAGVA
ncbi:MAG: LLM class flavin-dependent oxidoreductase [Chloroflexi bacterium]|jgi:alkanesulfonate monooxygenase SsuD/methylene tetrahydromethanopterin reductase-like flavin-dependent oxidoreductase (luciferase family)|nr:LLM class flavin-dependent oxidoreductase [Chloroflexota bacterium]MDP6498486.1 LLM class flavin-dependent oxidoreductase [Dehalococcoidia bacterium]MQG55584.1 LLM class flavin-dependent oxidoreductase [SAR202 cluster bacterium]|tara:strand:+ start:12912 stop:14171 length:1260 start_codon:yes stop_codon:yes gene_type:complete